MGFNCQASEGFECNGENCLPDKSACVGASCTFIKPLVDECTTNTHNCPDKSSCEDTLESYHCKADTGFACIDETGACKDSTVCEGNSCRFTVDECANDSNKCPENSSCVNTETGYTCKAVDGFECNGANCLPDKSACVGSSWEHEGKCFIDDSARIWSEEWKAGLVIHSYEDVEPVMCRSFCQENGKQKNAHFVSLFINLNNPEELNCLI